MAENPPPPDPQDPAEKASRDHEHDDLGAIFFYAMSLEQACIQYAKDAAADPKFKPRGPNSLELLLDAIRALLGPLPGEAPPPPPAAGDPPVPDPPLLLIQHRVNQRVTAMPPKNGGFS